MANGKLRIAQDTAPTWSKFAIPAGLAFPMLGLDREPATLRMRFATWPLEAICRENCLDPDFMLADDRMALWLASQWYCAHKAAGGSADPLAEELLLEVAADDAVDTSILDDRELDRLH